MPRPDAAHRVRLSGVARGYDPQVHGATELRIDPSIGLAHAVPGLSIAGERLVLDWPSRRSVVVVESKRSIRRGEIEHRRMAGVPNRPGRRRRSATTVRRTSGGIEASVIRLIETRDVLGLLNGTRSPESIAPTLGALMSFDGSVGSDLHTVLDALTAADWQRLRTECVGQLDIRSLLAIDAGVLARAPVGDTMLRILRVQIQDDLGNKTGVDSEFDVEPMDTVVLIRRCSILADRYDFETILELTEGITNIDDTTAHLCVVRGSAAAALGRDAEAAAAFAEAMRLQRTNERIVMRAQLERARHRVRRGHLGRALGDLRRVRSLEPRIDGIDRAIRVLARRC